ncbi:type II toxin-antitoxin system VapC family toxin [Oligoflexia bacterium]|nr:type II toxin-antitoxin system VapC family toxin [Oligoflexia bacterium]
MSEILLDTNVLLYAIDQDSKYHMWASRFFNDAKNQCATTSKNISEFLCVATRGEEPSMTMDGAINCVKVFCSHCKLLYPNSASTQLYFDLLSEHKPSGLLVHDFEIASISLSHGVNHFATANEKDFAKIGDLQLICPN